MPELPFIVRCASPDARSCPAACRTCRSRFCPLCFATPSRSGSGMYGTAATITIGSWRRPCFGMPGAPGCSWATTSMPYAGSRASSMARWRVSSFVVPRTLPRAGYTARARERCRSRRHPRRGVVGRVRGQVPRDAPGFLGEPGRPLDRRRVRRAGFLDVARAAALPATRSSRRRRISLPAIVLPGAAIPGYRRAAWSAFSTVASRMNPGEAVPARLADRATRAFSSTDQRMVVVDMTSPPEAASAPCAERYSPTVGPRARGAGT